MRTIAVITVSRSDYGIYLPLLERLKGTHDLNLRLIVGGAHLSPAFGETVQAIVNDGFRIDDRIEMNLVSDTPQGIAESMGLAIQGFAASFARHRPDILIVLGDRFEMHAAALAALPANIPVAHLHGGELSLGAMDDALRHSMTKLSHLHFVSTREYARRVAQLGEEVWRVTVSGALALENIENFQPMSSNDIQETYGVDVCDPPLLVTFHPVTLEFGQAESQVEALLSALARTRRAIVITMPNADTGRSAIARHIERFASSRERTWVVNNFGKRGYFSMMSFSAAMVGNSSSGIIEAPSFQLPVVNVGDRQKGRVRAGNVIDVPCEEEEILKGIESALDPTFRQALKRMKNPYQGESPSKKIVDVLREVEIDSRLIMKKFVDSGPVLPNGKDACR